MLGKDREAAAEALQDAAKIAPTNWLPHYLLGVLFIAEDRKKRKVANERKKFYDNVLAAVLGADSLLILGPGEAKGELSKQATAKKLRGLAVSVKTADRMSDRQIAAKVSEHFAKTPAAKSAALKKLAMAVPKRRMKESGS